MILLNLSIFLLVLTFGLVESSKESLNNYQLVRLYPTNDLQKAAINNFEENDSQVKADKKDSS
jgi:hypothetical protein